MPITSNIFSPVVSFTAKTIKVGNITAMPDITQDNMSQLLQALAVIVLRLRGNKIGSGGDKPLNLRTPYIEETMPVCLNVLKSMGCDTKLYKNLVANLVKAPSTVHEFTLPFVKNLRQEMRVNRVMHNSNSMNATLAKIFNPIMTLLSTPESEGSYKNLAGQISGLKQRPISNAFISDTAANIDSAVDLNQKLKDLSQKLGIKGTAPTTIQRQKWKSNEEKAAILKEYDKIKNLSKFAVRNNVAKIIQDSGKDHLPLREVSKQLEAQGEPNHFHPDIRKTNAIHVDSDSKFTDVKGNPLNAGNPTPISNGRKTRIVINPAYDPKSSTKSWVFYMKDGATDKIIGTRAYAKNVSAGRKQKAFGSVREALNNLPELKNAWREDFTDGSSVEDPVRTYAFLCEFLYWTAMRASSAAGGLAQVKDGKGNVVEKETYGAVSFQVKDMKIVPDKITMKFTVKGGHEHTYILNMNNASADAEDKVALKKLYNYLVKKVARKKPTDKVFTVERKPMNVQFFNKYIQSKGFPAKFTSHKFRHLRGSELGRKVLESATLAYKKAKNAAGGKALPNNVVNKIFNDSMTKVGEALGHVRGNDPTATTAVKYYVDPQMMVDWYKSIGYAPYIHSGVKDAAAKAQIAM